MKINTTLPNLIGIHTPRWLDELQERIASLREKWHDAQTIALIDCVFNEQSIPSIQHSGLPYRTLYDLSDTPSQELQEVSPTLVSLTSQTASAWREVVRLTNGWPMLSLIVTPESLDELALRLSPWCVVKADGQSFVFRFPDTRRLPCVVDVLTPKQHGEFFGPARAWLYRTRAARWAALSLPVSAQPFADEVNLDAEQCARLIGDSEADEILATLNTHESVLTQPFHPAEAHALITQGLKHADLYGIADADRMHWCALFLRNPQLEQIPAVIHLLTSLLSRKCAFADINDEMVRLVRTANSTKEGIR